MIWESEIQWYKEILPDLKVVFDVGCEDDNVFYELNPYLEIHLFEPGEVATELKGKFNPIALSNYIGESKFYPEYRSLYYRELKGDKWKDLTHKYITVQTSTVDQYCKENNIDKIDLLKIDTEGADLEVLLGAKNMLPNIKYIQFEEWTDKTKLIFELLESNGFTIKELGGKPINYAAWNGN